MTTGAEPKAHGKAATAGAPTRNLHWVFKVADRTATTNFYRNVLGMTVLRHEEFEQGCEAACNGPYAGKWSKTMIGYGPEDSQFVLELTYNYGVKSYDQGNDFRHIQVHSKTAYAAASQLPDARPTPLPGVGTAAVSVSAPQGYEYLIVDMDAAEGHTAMTELCLSVTELARSLEYWHRFLGFKVVSESATEVVLSCGQDQATLRLVQLPVGDPLRRGTAFGRVAFAAPGALLLQLQEDVQAAGYTVLTPYVSLDTPGKATVQVVILQDPDGHEICFVGDEGFRDLSQFDPRAAELLDAAEAADTSGAWFKKQQEEQQTGSKGQGSFSTILGVMRMADTSAQK